MAKTYRVGIIGRTGKGDYGHGLDTVWAEVPQTTVVAVADEHPGGRAAVAKKTGAKQAYADYREMLDKEDLDIVAVAPRWIDAHRDLVVACAEAGCHVYMEKPFCRTPAEADEMCRAMEMRHLKLAIAHQTRWSPTLDRARKLVEAGEIGEVLELRGRGKEDHRGGGEDLWVLGSHIMDLMRLFAGDPESCYGRVFAKGQPVTKNDVMEGREGIGSLAGDAVDAVFRFPGTVVGYFNSKRNQESRPSRFGLSILGSKGVIEVFTGYMVPGTILKDASWSPGRTNSKWQRFTSAGIDQPEPLKGSSLHDGNVAAVHDLLESIEADRQPKCSMSDARWTIEMISAVFDSHRQGGPVELPLKNRENALAMLKE